MSLSPDALFHTNANLTPNQRKLLKFILDNPEDVIFLTTAKLADMSGVSEATIVRLSQVLGYRGFKEMKLDLGRFIMSRLDTVTRLQSSVGANRSVGELMGSVVQQDIKNLNTLIQGLNIDTLDQVAHILQAAPKIYMVGLRSSYSLVIFFRSGLTMLGKQILLLTPEYWEMWRDVSMVGPGDIVFAISFPRYTRLTAEIVQSVHDAGATVISLTDSAMSPLVAHSNHVLFVPCRLDSFIESYVPALSVLNALITAVGFLSGPRVVEYLEKMEEIWKKKKIFHQIEIRTLPSWVSSERSLPRKPSGAKTARRKTINHHNHE
jgi:DNA-binding MurR/RpiR family transcriptional regulator